MHTTLLQAQGNASSRPTRGTTVSFVAKNELFALCLCGKEVSQSHDDSSTMELRQFQNVKFYYASALLGVALQSA